MTEKEANELLSKPFYTAQETAEVLHVHRNTISNWIKEGKLQAVKIGKSYCISKSEIVKLLTVGL